MAKRRVVEVKLEKVRLEATGLAGKRREQRLVQASLIWPRGAIAQRLALKTLEFANGEIDLGQESWTSRILFKEPVEGRFGISVGVTVPVTDAQLKKFLGYVSSSLLKLAGSEAAGVIDSAIVGGIAKAPLYGLAGLVTSLSKEAPAVAAEGELDLQAASLKATGKAKKLTVPLFASRTVYRSVRTRKKGRTTTSRRVLIKEGDPNGEAVVSVMALG